MNVSNSNPNSWIKIIGQSHIKKNLKFQLNPKLIQDHHLNLRKHILKYKFIILKEGTHKKENI